ncbi:MAG: glycosyltransferase family 2 protein [Vicinamibacterales bacterium]
MAPAVSIIIVNWNGRHHLDACLRAVQAQTDVTIETILVDNGSADGSVEFVRAAFPWVRVLALSDNRGFAGGNNAGVAVATAPYVMLLNNDTVVDPGCVRALVNGLDETHGIALTSARIVYMHDQTRIDSAGDGMLWAGGAFKRLHGRSVDLALESREVFGVCGAACLMPRRVYAELGGFDESFFFSHEDVDLSYRARLLGYRCRYVADAVVAHRGSGTSGRTTAFVVRLAHRNAEWLYFKNTPPGLLLRSLPSHILYTAAAAVYFARIGRLGAFLRGKLDAIAGMRAILESRRRVQASRRVSADAIAAQMDSGWMSAKLGEKRFDAGMVEEATSSRPTPPGRSL